MQKQIWFEENSGDLKLFRNDNINYKCNLYGDKLSEFLPNVSGVIGFKDRKEITVTILNLNNDNLFYRIKTISPK